MKIICFLVVYFAVGFYSIILGQNSDSLPLNQYRVLASHNSYKNFPNQKVLRFLTKFKKQLGESNDPIQLDYGHLPLPEQFDQFGVRGIEIDINYDPNGGLYKKRKINMFIFGLRQKVRDKKMKEPGFKVLHIADVDYETNYLTFKDVLLELKSWSAKNPNHSPIFINIEAKGSQPGNESKILKRLGFKRAIPFSKQAYDELDKEIFSILSPDNIFKPIDLLGSAQNIRERLTQNGWPAKKECLGKFIFILEGNQDELYLSNELNRPMFVYGNPGEEHTAFVIKNAPFGHEEEIQQLTKTYMVRTRADAGTIESRKNDYTRFNSAWKSGAQIISTDYYKPDLRFSTYQVKF